MVMGTAESDRPTRRRLIRLAIAALAVAAVFALGLLLRPGSALGLALLLAWPRGEAWLSPLLDSVEIEPIKLTAGARTLAADLYRPPAPRGGLLLVHGLSRAGRHHPELVRLARVLARHGLLVLVPHFDGLAAFRLTGREVADVDAALTALAARTPRVGVVGFSFGAGPALVAAASRSDLVLTASFGGYADLRAVLRYLTTGRHGHGGVEHAQPVEEYNRWKLLALLTGFVEDAGDATLLDAIARRKLADPGAGTEGIEADLGREGRAIMALVRNRSAEAVDPLVSGLSAGARSAIEALSPLPLVPRLPGRLVIAHGAGDTSIPFTESLRLAEASDGRARAVILETFEHTGPRPFWRSLGGRMRDGVRLVRLAGALLKAR
jgi:hypothetical protein